MEEAEFTRRIHAEAQNALKEFIKEGGLHSKLLDLGCGSGELTSILNDVVHAEEVCCIDMDEANLRKCSTKGFTCYNVNLELGRLPLPDDHFDIVTIMEVIEHLGNPYNMLREVYRVMKPDGVAIITTPNLTSWKNRIRMLIGLWPQGLALVPGQNRIAGFNRVVNDDPGHIRLYNVGALRVLLGFVGFDLVTVKGIPSRFEIISKTKKRFIPLGYLDALMARRPELAWHLLLVVRKSRRIV